MMRPDSPRPGFEFSGFAFSDRAAAAAAMNAATSLEGGGRVGRASSGAGAAHMAVEAMPAMRSRAATVPLTAPHTSSASRHRQQGGSIWCDQHAHSRAEQHPHRHMHIQQGPCQLGVAPGASSLLSQHGRPRPGSQHATLYNDAYPHRINAASPLETIHEPLDTIHEDATHHLEQAATRVLLGSPCSKKPVMLAPPLQHYHHHHHGSASAHAHAYGRTHRTLPGAGGRHRSLKRSRKAKGKGFGKFPLGALWESAEVPETGVHSGIHPHATLCASG